MDIVENINDGMIFLRKITKKDVQFLFDSLKEREVNEFLLLGPLMSMEHSRRLINNYLKYWNEFSQFTYIIEQKDSKLISKIGCASLWNLNWMHKRAEIGIWLIPSYFNQGIGTRVIELIKHIAFDHFGLHRLEAHTAIKNQNSTRLFHKTGFKEEGTLKDYINLHGTFHDVTLFALITQK
ncbi:MAG: GNAT family N-acetyltransferase [Promethearchaeota archaeon]